MVTETRTRDSLIIQGYIANYNAETFYGQIEVNLANGLIKAVAPISHPLTNKPDKTYSPKCIIFPGMGDTHVHAREDETGTWSYKEDYRTAADAALNGGLVHISAMPNTPSPVTTLEKYLWHRAKVKSLKHPVSTLNYLGAVPGVGPVGTPKKGPTKLYYGRTVGDKITFITAEEVKATLSLYEGYNVSIHAEDQSILDVSIDGRTHSERRPIGAVNQALKTLLPLIEKHRIKAKLCHWSTGGQSLEMIEEHRYRAKELGLPYTEMEISPLHIFYDTSMTDEDPGLWTRVQMNPAIQGPKHRRELIKWFKEGKIEYLATDHAPHTLEEKYAAFAEYVSEFPGSTNEQIAKRMEVEDPELYYEVCCQDGTSGAPWLDTYATVAVYLMEEENFSAQDIARVTGYNPGKFVNQFLLDQFPGEDFGLGFGMIEVGFQGSFTVVNTDKPTTIVAKNLKTKPKWSSFEGRKFTGGLEEVIIKGIMYGNKEAVYNNN